MKSRDKKYLIQDIYESRLYEEMKILQQKFINNGNKIDDERLMFLQDLHKMEIIEDSQQYSSAQLRMNEIDRLQKRGDMPPCMTYLIQGLNDNHHLKHFGRLQLGLFLKGAGLSLNEALHFWRQKFSKFTEDQFKKNYEYNIKHNYGKQGKHTDYTPMSCQKILSYNPLSDEYHGCPFKVMETNKLKNWLKIYYKINDNQYYDIEKFKKLKTFKQYFFFNIILFINKQKLACRELFKIKNTPLDKKSNLDQKIVDKIGTHPNVYFEQALRINEPGRFEDSSIINKKDNNSQKINSKNKMDLEF
ncbi:hypothetical protein IMG5_088440 [Ichthyophthirius multifiliis]|uniref:DNA primase large subunit C-terminal domain-containing protein n=1 Tax=Ichthyophthirius multifiliis TaxID=5932 RepID=G0QR44_ICHMU|nr:hypothetical protein IMG5_088440 [Ichthyophthirius multifiliis]EGR32312.1 hypothetical protein IMG5_088440 [Ichthyophthirius multifiliis]|eukprot:XP_004035798.1 hypothetical protein IMG5_088440 [Ichthyophthirius multifiliis]